MSGDPPVAPVRGTAIGPPRGGPERSVAARLASGAALFALACTPGPRSDAGVTEVVFDAVTELSEPVIVPLVGERQPIVEVAIEGAGTGRFLVDSAMELTLLDASFARRAGLPERPFAIEFLVETPGGRLQRLEKVAIVERLSIGTAHVSGLTPPLADLASLQAGIDGILGQDVLGDWAVLFDAEQHRLVLLPADDLMKRLAQFLPVGTPLEAIAVHGDDRIPCITFALVDPALEIDLHVDTGSTSTCLPAEVLQALGIGEGTPTVSTTLAGVETRRAWKVSDFPLGTQHVPVIVESTTAGWGLLGYDALRQRLFVLDGPGRRLLVQAPDASR